MLLRMVTKRSSRANWEGRPLCGSGVGHAPRLREGCVEGRARKGSRDGREERREA